MRVIDVTSYICSYVFCWTISIYMTSIVIRAIIWGDELLERY